MEKVKISRPKMDHEWTEKLAEVLKKLELEKELLENLEKNWDKDREQLQLLQKQQAESANGFRKILQGIGASEYNNGMFEGLKAIVGHQVSLVQSQAEALKLQEMVNKKRDLDVKNAIERQQKEQKAVQSAEKNWAIAKKNTLDIMVAYMAIHKVNCISNHGNTIFSRLKSKISPSLCCTTNKTTFCLNWKKSVKF